MEVRQKQINAYAPESCGLCGNHARPEIEHPCPACQGKGNRHGASTTASLPTLWWQWESQAAR